MIDVTAGLHTLIKSIRAFRLIALGLMVAATALAGCDQAQMTATQHVQRAQELRLDGKIQSAVLELKNALQQEPDNAAARFMLGELYLEVGNGTAAEKEFNRALEAGMDPRAVLLPRARAWLLQQDYQKVLDQLDVPGPDSRLSRAPVLALRGQAYLGLRRLDEAEAAFKEARQAASESLDAVVGLAQVAMAREDPEAAEGYLQQAQKLSPNNVDVIGLKGDIAFQRGDFAAAEAVYQTLVGRLPQNLVYRLSLAWAQIGNEKYEVAIRNLDAILRVVPEHRQTNYLRAVAAFRQQDYQSSRNFAERVLAVQSDHAPALLLAGATSYALGDLEQANANLSRFVGMAPQYAPGRKLLAAAQMRLGQSRAAIQTLKPLTASAGEIEDDQVLRLVAAAALQSGDMQSGRSYIERAVQRAPDNAELRAQLGVTRINLGEMEEGLSDLEAAVDREPEFTRAEVALAHNLIRSGDYDRALEIAHNLQETLPEDSIGYVLEGIAYDSKGDQEEAKAAYRKALDVDPTAADAVNNLAVIEIRNNRLEQGRQIYLDYLKKNPDSTRILFRLARLEARLGNTQEVEKRLKHLMNLLPENPVIRVVLGRLYLRHGRADEALAITQEILQDNPDRAPLLEVIGRAQLALGRPEPAAGTFWRLTDAQPSSPVWHYLLGAARNQAGDREGAWSAVDEALSLKSDYVPAQFLKGELAADMGRQEVLAAVLEALKEDYKDSSRYRELAASYALMEGGESEAVNLLQGIMDENPSRDVVGKLATVQARAGKTAEAVAALENWLADHPGDTVIRMQLSRLHLVNGDYEAATSQLERIVAEDSDSWFGQNDLAWVYYKQGKIDEALQHVEKAFELAPDRPEVLDTYGMILLESGRPETAIVYLERANSAMPEEAGTQFALARAYAASSRPSDAIRTLNRLLQDEKAFPQRDEAENLLQRLSAEER